MFLWGISFSGGILFALLLAILGFLWNLNNKLSDMSGKLDPLVSAFEVYDGWFRRRGLEATMPGASSPTEETPEHHSLSIEDEQRRDELVRLGRTRGLSDEEARELDSLLRQDAADDLAKGVLTFVAFTLVVAGIAALVLGLSRRAEG